MKIIDKKKDYYDYLMGVYGMDEKIVYDRRDSVTFDYFCKNNFIDEKVKESINVINVRIGNLEYVIEKNKEGKWFLPDKIYIYQSWREKSCCTNPRRLNTDEMKDKVSPISVRFKVIKPNMWHDYTYYTIENPIISSLPAVTGFISPETVWDEVYNFISSRYDKPIVDSRTEKQKIESAGFDSKTSFRNM